MSLQLPKLTENDFVVDYAMEKKHSNSSSSTVSTTTSSPNSCSTSSSKSIDQSKRPAAPAPEDHYFLKKRTMPSRFCPKQRKPTSRFQPTDCKENKAPRIPHVAKPIRKIVKRPLVEKESNTELMRYREFRQLEMEKAQDAKLTKGLEETSKKKRTQGKRKEIWEHNY